MSTRRLILRSFQSPGDILMLTAAVRDLHLAHPGQFETDVRTSADAIWLHNPHITKLAEGAPGVEQLDMHYPLIHDCNQRPYHFIHGYPQYLEQQFGIRIPITRFAGDIHLSAEERQSLPPGAELGIPEHFWIVMAGGKYDFTAKWWDPEAYQKVVDHFEGRITFIQCGEAGHWHPPLKNVISLVGKTNTREFIRLVYHATGILCPVTFAMHLAAAVETRPGRSRHRPCVVVAGGREPAHWEQYPGHQFLSTVGMLPCCAENACWKSRCQPVGDGDSKDQNDICLDPVRVRPDLRIARCMTLITPEQVIERIEMYYRGGALKYNPDPKFGVQNSELNGNGHITNGAHHATPPPVSAPFEPAIPKPEIRSRAIEKTMNVLINFRHGLGDAVQLTIILRHLQKHRPDWNVDVAALPGKHSAYRGLCRWTYIDGRESPPVCEHAQRFTLDWHECRQSRSDAPSTKAVRCLQEVFQIAPETALCHYSIETAAEDNRRARAYLEQVCQTAGLPIPDSGRFPVVLIHYEGNTSSESKNFSHEVASALCEIAIAAHHVPVILDWDDRSPLPDGKRIHCPGADHELWGRSGTGDAATLAALIEMSSLMVGVDSGPLHVAGATSTPTLAVWTRHHPIHFFDLADNVLHLVPKEHEQFAQGDEALRYFRDHYRHQIYNRLHIDLPALVESCLTGADFGQLANKRFLRELSATAYDRQYYDEHKQAGLDYLGFGPWQQEYGRWLVESLGLRGKQVLDVGCACGSILRGLGEAGAVVQGVDLNEHMIQLGRKRWPDMAPLLFICDAVNLHLFADESWDALHSAQVAEHWKPELVPFILRELRRIIRPGGLFFCALDTEELFARQGRTLEGEDPTHICIKPQTWWHEQLAQAGWQVATAEFEPALREHRETFLTRYDWDWFVARNGGEPAQLPLTEAIEAELRGGHANAATPVESQAISREGQPARDDAERPSVTGRPTDADDFCRQLSAVFHESDRAQLEWWLPHYRRLFELASEFKPNRICEVGGRAGYSAFAMLSANPNASLLGIEPDGDERPTNTRDGRTGLWLHARKILEPFHPQLLIIDSRHIRRLPDTDLIYLDGDHSYRGCLADLRLAALSTNRILVDDYDNIPNVRQACETFVNERPEFERRIDDKLTGFLLLEKRAP